MIISTTARKPGKLDEELASALASLVPNSAFVKRGAKGFFELYQLARKKGYRRVAVVSSDRVDFLRVDAGDWNWSDSYLALAGKPKLPRRLAGTDSLHFTGVNAGMLADFFDEEDDPDSETTIDAGEKKLTAMAGKNTLLEIACALKEHATRV